MDVVSIVRKRNEIMAYNKKDLEEKALTAIKENELYFIQDVVTYLPCSSATFYNHELEKLETIKRELEKNAIRTKVSMRKKWKDSDNATLQMGLMKLLSTDEERRRLAMEYREHSGEIKLPKLQVEYVKPDES